MTPLTCLRAADLDGGGDMGLCGISGLRKLDGVSVEGGIDLT